jgi:hypothetical protein
MGEDISNEKVARIVLTEILLDRSCAAQESGYAL